MNNIGQQVHKNSLINTKPYNPLIGQISKLLQNRMKSRDTFLEANIDFIKTCANS